MAIRSGSSCRRCCLERLNAFMTASIPTRGYSCSSTHRSAQGAHSTAALSVLCPDLFGRTLREDAPGESAQLFRGLRSIRTAAIEEDLGA